MAKKGAPTGGCTVCRHGQRGQIDYLVARGGVISSVADRFKINKHALYRHAANHITDKYKQSVRVGPFESEDRMRALYADTSTSVLENLRGIYGGLLTRWFVALEAESDQPMVLLTTKMHENLMHQAKLTKELAPVPSNVTLNIFTSEWLASFSEDMQRLVGRHPAIRDDVVNMLRQRMGQAPAPQMLDVSPAAQHAA